MMDQFMEQVATKRNSGMQSIMIGFAWVVMVITGVYGMLLFTQITYAFAESTTAGIVQIVASVIFLGTAGALSKILYVDPQTGTVGTQKLMMMILSLALGAVLGEIIDIDRKIEQFGEWLKIRSGNSGDSQFVNAFVTSSLTVCIGAMAIIGSIQDGISGDYSTLAAKSVLNFIIILIMASSLGKGCIFSAIPVGVLQGSVTLLARLIQPLMTRAALDNISLTGNILIFCVGVNLVWKGTVKVANLLPALIFAVLFAVLPVPV